MKRIFLSLIALALSCALCHSGDTPVASNLEQTLAPTNPEPVDKDTLIAVEFDGVTILVPPPPGCVVDNEQRKFEGMLAVFTEVDSPEEQGRGRKAEGIIGFIPDFGKKAATATEMREIFDNMEKSVHEKPKAVFHGDDFSSILFLQNGDTYTAGSLMLINNRIVGIQNVYPKRSEDGFIQSAKLHQAWRDAIIAANKK